MQTVLAARIDRLPPEDKQVLQAASAIGKDVPYAILAAIADQPEETLRHGLGHLQEAEFLYETRLFPDLEYTFKHALTHEVTYGSLLGDRRRQLHAQIMVAMERLYPDRLSEHVERLAQHAQRGHLWAKAVQYGRQAGNRALDRSAAREALDAFEQAAAALRELPESSERTEQRIDLAFNQRTALLPLGEFERLGEVLGEARVLAEGLGDQRRLGWALAFLSYRQSVHLCEPAQAIEAAEHAHSISHAVGDLGLRVAATYYLGASLLMTGDLRRAVETLHAVIALVEGARPGERFGTAGALAAIARAELAMGLAETGQFTEALDAGEKGLRVAKAVGHAYTEVVAETHLGYVYLLQGDFGAATRVLERGFALCRATGIPFLLPRVEVFLGSAYLRSGRAAEAVPLLEEAFESTKAVRRRSFVIAFRAEVDLVWGRVSAARQQAEQAVAVARTHRQQGAEAWGLKLLGEIHTHEPAETDRADQAYRQALALAADLGMFPLMAHCHLGLGKLYRRIEKHQEAHEHLTTATTMYREMDMRFWLEKAEAELRELA